MATNQTPVSVQQIIDRADWRRTLERDYQDSARRLLAAYTRTLPQIRGAMGDFNQRVDEWTAANPDERLSAGDVQNFREYADLLRRIEIEMRDFGAVIRNESGVLQTSGVATGADAAQGMASAAAGNLRQIVTTAWNRPDPAALERLINYVDGAAFRQKTTAFGENAVQNIADVILTAVAQGKNPRTIAQMLNSWLAVPYAWAENTARTVQLYSYRGASHASYLANSRVLDGWVWYAALDTRTCLSCISQHGRKYPLTASLNDHHQGRCTPVPIVKGSTWPDLIISGPNWFASQSPAYQQTQMGGALFRAWKNGAIGWNDMSQPYQDDVYGTMLREASVSGVLGQSDAKQYYWFNQ